MDVPEALPPALACLVGYFGYETVGLVEKLPRAGDSPLDLPDMIFVRPTVIIVFDRLKDEMFLIAPVWPENADAAADQVDRAFERLDGTERRLAQNIVPERQLSEDLPAPEDMALTPILAPDQYRQMVTKAKIISNPATYSRSCWHSALHLRSDCRPFRSIAPCGGSIRPRSFISSTFPNSH